jgi:hypothetical protein
MSEDTPRKSGAAAGGAGTALDAPAPPDEGVRDRAARVGGKTTAVLRTAAHAVRENAPRVGRKVSAPITKASRAIPEPARHAGRRAVRVAGRRHAVLGAAAACTAAALWLWRRGRRS